MKNKHLLHLFWVLLALPLFWAGCDLKEKIAAKFEPTGELPPITSEGVGSFGCLVNGEVWLPKGPLWGFAVRLSHDYHEPTGTFQVVARRIIESSDDVDSVYQVVFFTSKLSDIGLASTIEADFFDLDYCEGDIINPMIADTTLPWHLNIHHLDTEQNIIAGTFSFTAVKENCPDTIHITEGRFDIHY